MPRAARHERRLRRLQASWERSDARSRVLGTARLVSFLLALGCLAASAAWESAAGPCRWSALVVFLCFIALVRAHAGPRRRTRLLDRMVDVQRRELLRARGRWNELDRDGAGLTAASALVADLGVLGPWSLFQFVSRCATPFGERALAGQLARGEAADDLLARQDAVKELVGREALRQRLAAEGAQGALDGSSSRVLQDLLARGSVHDEKRWLAPACLALVLATAAQVILAFTTGLPTLLWLFVGVQVVVVGVTSATMLAEYVELSPHERPLLAWRGMMRTVEAARFRSELLRRHQDTLVEDDGTSASRALGELSDILAALAMHQGLMHPLVNVLLLWDIQQVARLAGWRRRHGERVAAWFRALGELEALASLAAHAADLGPPTFPSFHDEGTLLAATAACHPLLPPESSTPNDLSLDERSAVVLLTGSNMSGKSTLLRTVGLNVALALAGGAVHARSFRLRPCRIVTSIHVTDSLDAGVSLFYAEVSRIKQVLELAAQADADPSAPYVLFLIDEILRGTNTRERLIASRAIIRRLAASRNAGLVTSHEIGLTELVDELPRLRNMHFQESLTDDRMSFDYLLREGPVTTSNALAILRIEGLGLELED